MFDQIAQWAQDIITTAGYPGLIFIMFAENVFPPIPSEVVMPYAGFLIATENQFSLIGIVLSGTIGATLGALVLYYIGYFADEPIIRRFIRRYGRYLTISESEFDRAMQLFDKYGGPIVFFGRLIPIIRSLISVPAGMRKMPLPQFLLYTLLGTSVWNFALGYAGMKLGENWEDVTHLIESYQMVVIVVVVLICVGVLVWWFRRLRSRDEHEIEQAIAE
jgi:membrane protein DedA with SNARE-associated domain